MLRKSLIIAFSTLAACMQTACVAKDMTAACTVTGAQNLSENSSPDDICSAFQERLGKALSEKGNASAASDISVAIELHKRGSVQATVTSKNIAETKAYPEVVIDVMDRSLNAKDLDKLANAVAQLLTQK